MKRSSYKAVMLDPALETPRPWARHCDSRDPRRELQGAEAPKFGAWVRGGKFCATRPRNVGYSRRRPRYNGRSDRMSGSAASRAIGAAAARHSECDRLDRSTTG